MYRLFGEELTDEGSAGLEASCKGKNLLLVKDRKGQRVNRTRRRSLEMKKKKGGEKESRYR